MKEENLLSLIKELSAMNELHQEYQDNNIHYVIDAIRDGNVLKFNVEIQDTRDKEEFEKWASQLDDEFFSEVWESLSKEDELHSLNELYESPNYREVIQRFKNKARQIAKRKIDALNKLFDLD